MNINNYIDSFAVDITNKLSKSSKPSKHIKKYTFNDKSTKDILHNIDMLIDKQSNNLKTTYIDNDVF